MSRVDKDAEHARDRFRREARLTAGLDHPAIIRIFDILEADGTDWIVMELVKGPNLAALLRDGPLDVGLVLDYGPTTDARAPPTVGALWPGRWRW